MLAHLAACLGDLPYPPSRLRAERRWRLLAEKRRAAETAGIAWSVWSWISDFGIATGPDRTVAPGGN